jgi:hypothetical protein
VNRRKSLNRRQSILCENLETRRLLSAAAIAPALVVPTDGTPSFQLADGVLTLTGTAENDTVSFTVSAGNVVGTCDAVTQSYPSGSVSSIQINEGGGSDSITLGAGVPAVTATNNVATIAQNGSVLDLTGTSGNDTLNVTNVSGTLTASVASLIVALPSSAVNSVSVDGGGGIDSLTISGGLPAVTATDNGVTISQPVLNQKINRLQITGTSGNDMVNLSSTTGTLTASIGGLTEILPTAAVPAISVTGGGGSDSVVASGSLPNLGISDNGASVGLESGVIAIMGTSGNDTLNLSTTTGTLTTAIDGLSLATATSAVTEVVLQAGNGGSDFVNVGTGVPTVSVSDGDGTNFSIAAPGGTLNQSGHTLDIVGTSGNDTVNLSGGSSIDATLGSVSETFTNGAINQIDVNGGGGNDSLTTGFGVPAVAFASGLGTISISGSVLSVGGTSGSDTVNLSISGNSLSASVDNISELISASSITAVKYGGGSGSDSVTIGAGVPAVTATGNGATVAVNGAAINVSSINAHDVSSVSSGSSTVLIGIDGLTVSAPSTGINGINLASTGSNAVTVGTGVPPVSVTGSNNTINGQTISEVSGAVTITGTPGNDTTSLSVSNHNLVVAIGGATQSIPLAGLTSVSMSMLAGNDSVSIGAGAPAVSVLGGGGNDTILAVNSANNTLSGGAGNDSLGGNGSGNNLLLGGAGHDTIVCGTGNNTLNGGLNYDSLVGGSGSDLLIGGPGTDVLSAGSGNNTLNGGKGNDTLLGGIGADLLNGGAGSNSIQPASPQSTIKGATAADSIVDGTTGTSQAISAQSNIYGAGFTTAPDPGGSTTTSGGGGGTLPPAFTFAAGSNQILTFSSVTGSVSLNGGQNHNGPDGNGSGQISSTSTGDSATTTGGTGGSGSTAATGISGITAPGAGYLVGIFETSAAPSGTAPASLNYLSGLSTSATDYYPLLDQVFYIGDGLTGTGSGAVQKFHVPAGATRLFLGISDAPGDGNSGTTTPGDYDDNSGFFTVTFKVAVPFFSE